MATQLLVAAAVRIRGPLQHRQEGAVVACREQCLQPEGVCGPMFTQCACECVSCWSLSWKLLKASASDATGFYTEPKMGASSVASCHCLPGLGCVGPG